MDEVTVVRRKILEENNRVASGLREEFARNGTLVVNLISSPGTGKTTLLEKTVADLGWEGGIGVLVGDVATERDAERIRAQGFAARQILTGGGCHLDARLVETALQEAGFDELRFLFIENVGNLICPASYDLGEDFKAALLSVTEGDDKPFKYPAIFSKADVTVITKADLLPYVSFDLEAVRQQIRCLNPAAAFLVTSAVTEKGLKEWCGMLKARAAAKQALCP